MAKPHSAASVRERGQQRGAPGHGRKPLRGQAAHSRADPADAFAELSGVRGSATGFSRH